MLYDPKWEKPEVKAQPLSPLAKLVAWLEKQPPETVYDWSSPRVCLIGQWLKASEGLTGSNLGSASCAMGTTNPEIAMVAYPVGETYTFGAALERARKFLADER